MFHLFACYYFELNTDRQNFQLALFRYFAGVSVQLIALRFVVLLKSAG